MKIPQIVKYGVVNNELVASTRDGDILHLATIVAGNVSTDESPVPAKRTWSRKKKSGLDKPVLMGRAPNVYPSNTEVEANHQG